ncbi:acyl-homoserine-lactone synthase [Jannaschia aquimarina]|uniref:Acyl-homoserine-lactone synthase n=1 Tax=Jannaschia aquimarina TaxID=935700 RepID=A0A0D1CS89_9RHOB|nr:acyl-homoserine-lactone synthase [Jannaschia aquimarina]KIT17652.1 Acyl-homoserine-lactone synthase [Jannaschia aquimarina]SNS79912.1 acyl homoserine lactone synthase [Jannaschia aquimarina]
MLRYLYATDLERAPDLAAGMFRDRAAQFRDRLGWDVQVDALGWETDQYDVCDPLYVIATDRSGAHLGSLRFLPTTGPHMLAEVFPHLAPRIHDRDVWEATRFCLAPRSPLGTARLLLLAASQLGLSMGLTHALGVFDGAMPRVYRRLGWEPEVLGQAAGIAAGRWTFDPAIHDRLCHATGVSPQRARDWFEADLGHLPLPT